jgi:WD40 repeat protein
MTLEQLGAGIDFVSDSTPANAADGDTFLDTSLSPPQVKVFDASVGSFVRPQTAQNLDQPVSNAGASLSFQGGNNLDNVSFNQISLLRPSAASPFDVAVSSDGTKGFILTGSEFVREYDLAEPFSFIDKTFVDSLDLTAQNNSHTAITFGDAGTKLYATGKFSSNDEVNQFNLGTAFDVSTATFAQSLNVSSQSADAKGIAFADSGTRLYIVAESDAEVNQFNLGTAFDISTASFVQLFDLSAQDSFPKGVTFSQSGQIMIISGADNNSLFQYLLSTPFDISTATFTKSFDVSGQTTFAQRIAAKPDGTKIYLVGSNNNKIIEYIVGSVGSK